MCLGARHGGCEGKRAPWGDEGGGQAVRDGERGDDFHTGKAITMMYEF